MNKMALKVKILDERAKIPKRATDGSVGYDIFALSDGVIKAKSRNLVDTGVTFEYPIFRYYYDIPILTYGQLKPRSSLAWKNKIDVGAGVLDNDYRGSVKVLLINNGDVDFEYKAGDAIAQLVIELALTPDIIVVDELSDTKRGEGGFGSTNK